MQPHSFSPLVLLLTGHACNAAHHEYDIQHHARALANVYSNCAAPNTVALTFDDGPYIYHQNVSQILSDAGIHGTFFVNGDNFRCIYDPPQVSSLRASYKAGHQIASHTWSHPDLTTLTEGQIRAELEHINAALHKILGIVPTVLRPPFGYYNDDVRMIADRIGQSLVLWSFDSQDSRGATTQASQQAYTALASRQPSHIISLQHETIDTTVTDVLPFAIKTLKDAGYNFATISECLGIPAYQSVGTPSRRDASWNC